MVCPGKGIRCAGSGNEPYVDPSGTHPSSFDRLNLGLVQCIVKALMCRFRAFVVLLAVSFNAMWCLDGCIDPFAFNDPSSTSAASISSDIPDTPEARTCVMCVVPFEQEQAVVLVPAWAFGVTVPVFRAVSPLLAPRARIEHPPRIA